MTTLRRAITVLGIAALTASSVTSCGGPKGGTGDTGGTASKGGEINATVTSFPDYVDPQLSYTVEGWEVLWNTYIPLLT
ncbi:MAG: ABC transporter substrate-binding protein, partial [Mycobacterium sp.]